MIRNQHFKRTKLVFPAMALVIALVSSASAQFTPYNPAGPAPVGNNHVVVWDLDQGSGTTATDLANPVLDGNNAGTLTGPAVSWTAGKFGGGLHFVGGSGAGQPANVGYVSTAVDGSLFTASRQAGMAAWINPSHVNPTFGFNYIMGWNGPDSSYAYLRFGSAGSIGFGLRVKQNTTYQWAEISYATPYDQFDGTWRHVAGIFNDGTLKMYVDGSEVASFDSGYTATSGWSIVPPTSFAIGGVFDDPSDTRLNYAGDMDDIRLFSIVPEPSVGALAILGALGVMLRRRVG
jgi:hypothetical protein